MIWWTTPVSWKTITYQTEHIGTTKLKRWMCRIPTQNMSGKHFVQHTGVSCRHEVRVPPPFDVNSRMWVQNLLVFHWIMFMNGVWYVSIFWLLFHFIYWLWTLHSYASPHIGWEAFSNVVWSPIIPFIS